MNDKYALCGEGSRQLLEAYGIGGWDACWSVKDGEHLHGVDDNYPPLGTNTLMKVGMFHMGDDGLRESFDAMQEKLLSWVIDRMRYRLNPFNWSGAPQLDWYRPDPEKLLESEGPAIAERLAKDEEDGRESWFEIMNEPNGFRWVDPYDAAKVFIAYRDFIKSVNPNSKVVGPSLWDWNLVPEDTREEARKRVFDIAKIYAAQYINAEVDRRLSRLPRFMRSAARGTTRGIVNALFLPTMVEDIYNALAERLYKYDTGEYLAVMMEQIAEYEKPDFLSVHFYPLDIGRRFSAPEVVGVMEETLGHLQQACPGVPFLVTEYGNANPYIGPEEVRWRMTCMHEFFDSRPDIRRWFFFKPTGVDGQVTKFLPGVPPPFSRFVDSAGYVPDSGDFKSNLNWMGIDWIVRFRGQ